MLCDNCGKDVSKTVSLRWRRTRANEAFWALGTRYHDGLPINAINSILEAHGFRSMEEAIYCGSDGAVREDIGDQTWLSFTWHKMPSGRYEVVIYVN